MLSVKIIYQRSPQLLSTTLGQLTEKLVGFSSSSCSMNYRFCVDAENRTGLIN